MLIRQETASDLEAIDAVHRAAFRQQAPAGAEPVEIGLVRALRADAGWVNALSLVAEDAAGTVIGHVVCTEGDLAGTPAVGLGPIGVLPDQQGNGAGAALMHAVLAAADALGYPVVILLGHLEYYPRFGFQAAGTLGIHPTDPGWGDHFQARTLSAWSPQLGGLFRYADPFQNL
jgi:putative acetyltransferase